MVSGILLHFRLGLSIVCALFGLALVGAGPAYADLRVCNQTANPVSIALGYRNPRGWQSEGWWVAPPGKCATVFQGDLNTLVSSFYYLFAADDIGGGSWDGNVIMCTRDEAFTIFDVDDCLARGYEITGFFEVDTKDRSDWMIQLTDADSVPGADDEIPDSTIPLEDDGAPLEGEAPLEGAGEESVDTQ